MHMTAITESATHRSFFMQPNLLQCEGAAASVAAWASTRGLETSSLQSQKGADDGGSPPAVARFRLQCPPPQYAPRGSSCAYAIVAKK